MTDSPPASPTLSPDARSGPLPAELQALLERFALALDHPPACHEEARAHLAAPGFDDPALTDLEDLPFVTIDNDDSRDLDQALFIEPVAGDGHIVWYALADAAYYVRPGSALFAEALRRGASFYLPELVVPMLPTSLSEGLVSLNEGVPRRAVVFRVTLDDAAEVRSVDLVRARIRSRKKLSYRGVQRFWDGADVSLAAAEYAPSLMALRIVGARRIALAEARQVIRYQRLEVEVAPSDRPGPRFIAFEARRFETDRMNEQISLLVNVEGARLLAERLADRPASSLQAIFRVHPAPTPEDLAAFARMTAAATADLDPTLAWAPDEEPLARWLARIADVSPEHRDIVLALQRQALLLNQRSTFAAEPGLHFGVGAPCYARFTSPMREIVGIFTHKEALELLGLLSAGAGDEALREAVIDAANRAKELQSQLTKAANLLVIEPLLAADLALPEPERPRRAGTVLGLSPDRAYVLLDDPPLELKLYARDLGRRWHLADEATALVIAEGDAPPVVLHLGARVTLVVTGRDPARERFTLALASPPHPDRAAAPPA